MSTPAKYEHIDFRPPNGVKTTAARGLALRKEHGRGGLSTGEAGKQGIGSGVARAAQLVRGGNVSPKVIRQMVAFFSRHKKNRGDGSQSPPSNGYIAWLLWGGDAGMSWANKVKKQMEAADGKVSAASEDHGTDRSDNETVVEYAIREVLKNKSPKAAAAATAKKLSGFENMFLGPGVSIIDPKKLEAAIWGRIASMALGWVNKRGISHEDAAKSAIQYYWTPKNWDRDVEANEKKYLKPLLEAMKIGKVSGALDDLLVSIQDLIVESMEDVAMGQADRKEVASVLAAAAAALDRCHVALDEQ